MSSPFKVGSQPHKLNEHFKQGKSLTHDEAHEMGIGRLAQRMQDLKKTYEEKAGHNPIMVIDEPNARGGKRSRYFFKGTNSPLEANPAARDY